MSFPYLLHTLANLSLKDELLHKKIFSGGEFNWHIVLVMGFSTIAANALSLGAGEYLSSKAHREFIQVEKRRETWEFKHFKDVETREVNPTFFVIIYNMVEGYTLNKKYVISGLSDLLKMNKQFNSLAKQLMLKYGCLDYSFLTLCF